MTDTEATGDKPEVTAEQKAQRQSTRAVARALSKIEGKGTREEQKARWDANKATYTTNARKLVKALAKEGVTLNYDETATDKAKRGAKKVESAAD